MKKSNMEKEKQKKYFMTGVAVTVITLVLFLIIFTTINAYCGGH